MAVTLTHFLATVDALKQTYHQAVTYFNAGKGEPVTDAAWVGLEGLLDQTAMVTGIDKAVAYKGPTAVINFLQSAGASFTNDTILNAQVLGAGMGVVSGIANWKDADNDNDGLISFNFEFIDRNGSGTDWKILRLTATTPKAPAAAAP